MLARDGVGKASVRTVAAQAGVSAGLVGHYFPTMDALVAATYADVGLRVNTALEAAVAAAGDMPRARLDAFVMANFTAPVADPELLGTWIAFWGLARGHPAIAAQHDAQYAAFRARLERLLVECGVRDALLRQAAIAVTAMIDGLWLELCLSSAWLTADEAGAIARLQLDYLIDRSVSRLR